MLRTGEDYKDSIRDGRQVWIDGEKVDDVTTHPAFRPLVDIRARIYDLAHGQNHADVMTYRDPHSGDVCATESKPPLSKEDWRAKRASVDAVMDDVHGVVTRVGDETVGEMWSLLDGRDVLDAIDPKFSENIARAVEHARVHVPFHVSANTDPKGDRSRWPHEQDPDVILRAVGENDRGIIVRGAKFETAAAYANQAFVKPTIADWGSQPHPEYALGFLADMSAPGIKHICRSGFAGRGPDADYPLTNRFDEVDTMIVFDDVEIPWENVFFYRSAEAASFIRATLHRYSIFPWVQRHLRYADLMLGTAYISAQQTGVKIHQEIREKIAQVAAYREAINAALTTAVETAQVSPSGMIMPNQQAMFTGRVLACTQLPMIMHTVRDITGAQTSLVPSATTFADPEAGIWLDKYFRVGETDAEERRKLLAYTRDLLDSEYASHRLAFQLFAQSPPFSHLLSVYNNYDFAYASDLVRESSGMQTQAPQPLRGAAALRAQVLDEATALVE